MRATRALTALALVAVVVLNAGTAGASSQDPFAGDVHTASVVVKLDSADGIQRQIDLYAERADSPARMSSYVRISLRSCRKGICSGDSYARLLQPEEFAVDDGGTSGRLETTFAGLPLIVQWSDEPCDGVCVRNSGIVFSGGGSATWRREAKVRVEASILGLDCTSRGLVSRETTVTTAGPPAPPPENEPNRPPAVVRSAGLSC